MRAILTFVAVALVLLAILDFGRSMVGEAQQGGDSAARGLTVKQLDTTCLTWPLGMVAGVYLMYRFIFTSFVFYGKREAVIEQERAIRQSGSPAASMVSSGRIGAFGARGPLLKTTLYPGGLLVQTPGLPPIPIPLAAIRSAIFKTRPQGIEIKHSSRLVAGPIFLACAKDEPLWWALETLLRTGQFLDRDGSERPHAEASPSTEGPDRLPSPVARPWVGGTSDSQRYGQEKAD